MPSPQLLFTWLTKNLEVNHVSGNRVSLSQWTSVSWTLLWTFWCLKVCNCFSNTAAFTGVWKMESCDTLTDQCCIICLTAWISVAWSSSWAGKKYLKKTWEQSPVCLGITTGESFSVWKWQPWLFAASLWKILWLLQGIWRPLCPGEFQLHWLLSQSFFSWFALIKSLEDVWSQEVEISTWETELSCWNALHVIHQMIFSHFDLICVR